jgi:hypothetical protein
MGAAYTPALAVAKAPLAQLREAWVGSAPPAAPAAVS